MSNQKVLFENPPVSNIISGQHLMVIDGIPTGAQPQESIINVQQHTELPQNATNIQDGSNDVGKLLEQQRFSININGQYSQVEKFVDYPMHSSKPQEQSHPERLVVQQGFSTNVLEQHNQAEQFMVQPRSTVNLIEVPNQSQQINDLPRLTVNLLEQQNQAQQFIEQAIPVVHVQEHQNQVNLFNVFHFHF